jgi:hypothetical protein
MLEVKTTLLLADAGQVSNGKLYILGAGWDFTDGKCPSAVVAQVEVPWDSTNVKLPVELVLLDADGQIAHPHGSEELRISFEAEAGRPAGLTVGTPISIPMAWNFGPLGLPAGRYTWQLAVGETVETRAFSVI